MAEGHPLRCPKVYEGPSIEALVGNLKIRIGLEDAHF